MDEVTTPINPALLPSDNFIILPFGVVNIFSNSDVGKLIVLEKVENSCGLLSVTTCALMLLKDISKVKSTAAL